MAKYEFGSGEAWFEIKFSATYHVEFDSGTYESGEPYLEAEGGYLHNDNLGVSLGDGFEAVTITRKQLNDIFGERAAAHILDELYSEAASDARRNL